MKIKEIIQKVFEPVEIAGGVFIAGKHIKDYRNAFHKKFDEDGRLIYKHTMQPSYNSISDFEYDDKNNLITETIYSEKPHELYRSEHFLYNESGLLLSHKKAMAGEKAGEPSYTNYFYDNQGRQIKVNHYSFGEFSYSEIINYDETGVQKSVFQQNKDNRRTNTSVYQLNEQGQIKEVRSYDENGFTGKLAKYLYDNSNRLIEVISTKGEEIQFREIQEYDMKGNLTLKKRFNEDQENPIQIEQNIFEYDENYEWTNMTIYINNEIKSIVEREVKYF